MKASHIFSSRRAKLVGCLIIIDGVIFGLTDPQRVSSLLLAGGFILLTITLYQLLQVLLVAADLYGLPGRDHRHRQARVLTGVIGGLVALQSMGELGSRDVLVALPLALLAYMYISYGKSAKVPVPVMIDKDR